MVMTRPASDFNSVQWLKASPATDSTSIPAGKTKTQPKDARARDVHRGVDGEDGAVFTERERILGFDADVGFDGGGVQQGNGLGVRVTEGAAHGEAGN